ncbi:MAG: type II toxin-antitoxin system HicA family toxin [Phycisphaeraceae bacterium]
MNFPRDLSGDDLIKRLERVGYRRLRQSGSHARLVHETTKSKLTVPLHESMRVGTAAAIVRKAAEQLGVNRDELARELFG